MSVVEFKDWEFEIFLEASVSTFRIKSNRKNSFSIAIYKICI